MRAQPQIRDFKKYVNKLKAMDDAIDKGDYCIEDIVEEMAEDDYTIKEVYEFLIQNYDDHYIPRILEVLYCNQGGDDYELDYPYFKASLIQYEARMKECWQKNDYYDGPAQIVEEMAVYYSLDEIYNFLEVIVERYDDFIFIGAQLFHLYRIGYY